MKVNEIFHSLSFYIIMIEINNVSKKIKKTEILHNISFKVDEGEIVGLLGENGAGKTTILRLISTMLKLNEGKISVNNIDIKKHPEKVRNEIGILFGGDVGLYERLTGRENIMYFANLYGMKEEEAIIRINALSKELNMEEYIDLKVGTYSRGMKQKISIARSIVHNPSVMLFDEPCTGLDVRATRIIRSFIKKCKEENKTVLFSSHSMEEVQKLCDRVVIINKGNLLEDGSINYLKDKYHNEDLEEVFLKLIGGEDYE